MRHHAKDAFIFIGLLLLGLCFSCREPESVVGHITIVVPKTPWSWPLYVAQKAKYYEKEGLNVDFKFAFHPVGVAMLTSGEADVNLMPLERAMALISKDDSFACVGSPLGKSLFSLMVRKDSGGIRQLVEKRLGITQMGDGTHTAALAILRRFGIPKSSVQVIVIGSDPGRVAALSSGRVDATMVGAPAYFDLEQSGFVSLANVVDFEDIESANVLVFRKKILSRIPSLQQSIIRAQAQAVKRFYADKEFAVEAYLDYDKQNRMGIERAYDVYARKQLFDRVPYISAGAVNYASEVFGIPVSAHLTQSINNYAVDELSEQHFFSQLFGASVIGEEKRRAILAFR